MKQSRRSVRGTPYMTSISDPALCPQILCTEKCRFMDKRVREISLFFVVLPHVFPLFVHAPARARQRTVLSTNASSSVQSKAYFFLKGFVIPTPGIRLPPARYSNNLLELMCSADSILDLQTY